MIELSRTKNIHTIERKYRPCSLLTKHFRTKCQSKNSETSIFEIMIFVAQLGLVDWHVFIDSVSYSKLRGFIATKQRST